MAQARRAGTIERVNANTFRVKVFSGYNELGKRQYISARVHGNKKDAQAVLNEMLVARDTGKAVVAPRRKAPAITLEAFAKKWLDDLRNAGKNKRTVLSYEDSLRLYVFPTLGAQPVNKITKQTVATLVRSLNAKGLKPRTVLKARGALRRVLSIAVARGIIPTNPALGRDNELVKESLPTPERTDVHTLPTDKLAAFTKAAESEPLRAFFTLMLYGGFRPSEALALRWRDVRANAISVTRALVDVPTRPMYVADTKTKKSRRTVVMSKVAMTALQEHKARQAAQIEAAGDTWVDNDLIFPDEFGGFMRQDRARDALYRILKSAGLPKMRVYDLRHTHATWLLEQGVDISVVSERLGHSTITLTVDTYGHVTKGMQDAAAAALDKLAA